MSNCHERPTEALYKRLGLPVESISGPVQPASTGVTVLSPCNDASGLKWHQVRVASLEQARKVVGEPAESKGGTPHFSDDATSPSELGQIAAAHIFQGVEISSVLKDRINASLMPATLAVAAASQLVIKKGETYVIDTPGAIAFDSVTIESGGHLVVAAPTTVTIGTLTKKSAS